MWTCRECGRTFEKREQIHYCGKSPETVDEYIASQPEQVREFLKEIRETLRAALPEAEERISWRMPTYWKKHNIIHFAAFKNHAGLYLGPAAVQEFSGRLKEHKTSKDAIQLPYSMAVPTELVSDIARWCFETGNHPNGNVPCFNQLSPFGLSSIVYKSPFVFPQPRSSTTEQLIF